MAPIVIEFRPQSTTSGKDATGPVVTMTITTVGAADFYFVSVHYIGNANSVVSIVDNVDVGNYALMSRNAGNGLSGPSVEIWSGLNISGSSGSRTLTVTMAISGEVIVLFTNRANALDAADYALGVGQNNNPNLLALAGAYYKHGSNQQEARGTIPNQNGGNTPVWAGASDDEKNATSPTTNDKLMAAGFSFMNAPLVPVQPAPTGYAPTRPTRQRVSDSTAHLLAVQVERYDQGSYVQVD